LITEIVLDHAVDMSTDPGNEVVFILAHGPRAAFNGKPTAIWPDSIMSSVWGVFQCTRILCAGSRKT